MCLHIIHFLLPVNYDKMWVQTHFLLLFVNKKYPVTHILPWKGDVILTFYTFCSNKTIFILWNISHNIPRCKKYIKSKMRNISNSKSEIYLTMSPVQALEQQHLDWTVPMDTQVVMSGALQEDIGICSLMWSLLSIDVIFSCESSFDTSSLQWDQSQGA